MHSERYICRCGCGESALVACIEAGNLIVEFPCSICGQRHKTSIPLDDALRGNPVPLFCTITDTIACYVGLPDSIAKMDSKQSDEEISAFVSKLLGDHPEFFLNDAAKYNDLITAADALCAVQELAYRNGLSCKCGSYKFTAGYDEGILRISCTSCGTFRDFNAYSTYDIKTLLSCGSIIL